MYRVAADTAVDIVAGIVEFALVVDTAAGTAVVADTVVEAVIVAALASSVAFGSCHKTYTQT